MQLVRTRQRSERSLWKDESRASWPRAWCYIAPDCRLSPALRETVTHYSVVYRAAQRIRAHSPVPTLAPGACDMPYEANTSKCGAPDNTRTRLIRTPLPLDQRSPHRRAGSVPSPQRRMSWCAIA